VLNCVHRELRGRQVNAAQKRIQPIECSTVTPPEDRLRLDTWKNIINIAFKEASNQSASGFSITSPIMPKA
jgi:hypothetical protein